MYYYKDLQTPSGDIVRQMFLWIDDNRQINFPDVETNMGVERQAYLAWLAEGNTPEPLTPEPAPINEAQPSFDAG